MPNQKQVTSTNEKFAEQVKEAFQAVRHGEFGPSSALQEYGQKVVPFLAPYLKDANEDVRRQAVTLLKLAGGEEAAPLLAKALADPVEDIRKRAAMALYERYDPAALSSNTALGKALRKYVKEDGSAAAVLLLGYFPGRETENVLKGARNRKPQPQTELYEWSPVVPVSLPARVALSRLGAGDGRTELLQTVETATLDELEFLLAVLREIDAPEVLHLLKRTLDDTREISKGTPSGATPKRRLCDEAVNAFVRRLQLPVTFELTDSQRYDQAQINEVRNKINAAIPR